MRSTNPMMLTSRRPRKIARSPRPLGRARPNRVGFSSVVTLATLRGRLLRQVLVDHRAHLLRVVRLLEEVVAAGAQRAVALRWSRGRGHGDDRHALGPLLALTELRHESP